MFADIVDMMVKKRQPESSFLFLDSVEEVRLLRNLCA